MRPLLFLFLCLAILLAACGGSKANSDPGVLIEPAQAPFGGKPAQSSAPIVAPTEGPTTAPGAPTAGKWIEVDVTRYRVRLMDGSQIVRTIEPVAVGAQVDTGAYESTQTGLFHVYNKIAGLQYDPPYKTYISDWVGFDSARANGFHSFLEDEKGNIVNPGTGRISNGCIRTGDAAAIFAFAEVGMPVFVHA